MRHLPLTLALASLWAGSLASTCAAELSLKNAASVVSLTPAEQTHLAERLDAYFKACHPYSRVVAGPDRPQDELTKLWSEQERTVHAVLRGTDGREILFAFPTENDGLGPVLARDADGTVTSYAKCPGLEGLKLACQVHGLVPGLTPSSRCAEPPVRP